MMKNKIVTIGAALSIVMTAVAGCSSKKTELGSGPAGEPEKPVSAAQQLPQLAAAERRIDLQHMKDAEVICTVDGTPITVGDYRRDYTMDIEQVKQQLSMSEGYVQSLIQQGEKQHIALTADEKKRLTETAHKASQAAGGALSKFLVQNHMNEAQLVQHVIDVGLAEKVAAKSIQGHLLGHLVDWQLFSAAARAGGMSPAAYSKYTELKKNPQTQELVKANLLSADQLKDAMIKDILVKSMMDKIQSTAVPTDAQIQEYYNKNKEKFVHGDRIRLSQIFIAAPRMDSSMGPSIRTMVAKQHPDATQLQIDAEAKKLEGQAHGRARDIMQRVQKGEDFATLANEFSDDIANKTGKLGGDMGYQEQQALAPQFRDRILSLKKGQVYLEPIASPIGFHIIKLVDKEPKGYLPLAELKDQIKQGLTAEYQNKALFTWLFDKRKAAKVELSPEFQKLVAAAPPGGTAGQTVAAPTSAAAAKSSTDGQTVATPSSAAAGTSTTASPSKKSPD